MPLPAPKPVDALRQHTRAVVLVSADGDASSTLLDAIRDSEIPCELIGHPLVAMAELVRLEQDNRLGSERTALFVADDERIEQLSTLFQAVRNRLPHVAIWVIAGDLAVLVQRAVAPETAQPVRPAGKTAPQLRIVDAAPDRVIGPRPAGRATKDIKSIETAAQTDASDESDARIDPNAAHSTAITAEELDMLLGFGDEDPSERGERPGGRR